MGSGGSKTESVEDSQTMQASQVQTATNDHRSEQTLAARPDGTTQSTKRQRESELESEHVRKKPKRSDGDNFLNHDNMPTIPQCPTGTSTGQISPEITIPHRPKETPSPSASATTASKQDSGEDTDGTLQHFVPTSAIAPRSGGDCPGCSLLENQSSAETQPQETNSAGVGELGPSSSAGDAPEPPYSSTSTLSQEMSIQLEHASQAIRQAAAASQDLADEHPLGWNTASESPLSPTERDHNRRLISEAITKLHGVEDSETFTPDRLARSKTRFHDFQRSIRQTPYSGLPKQASEVAPEVTFVADAKDQAHSFSGYAVRRRSEVKQDRRDSSISKTSFLESEEGRGPRKLKRILKKRDSATSRRPSSVSSRQRRLISYWKGWPSMISVKALE